jgi:uncharacterized membrane protein YdbT with pleckstrin-like domain
MNVFKPSLQYLTKIRLVITLASCLLLALGLVAALFAGLLEGNALRATRILQVVITLELIGIPNALILARLAYDHRAYALDAGEIVLHTGAWAESTRSFPLDRVVSLRTHADWLDRRLGIGTLEVQLTSWRSVTGTRLHLSGLEDVEGAARLLTGLLLQVRDDRLSQLGFTSGAPERSLLTIRH